MKSMKTITFWLIMASWAIRRYVILPSKHLVILKDPELKGFEFWEKFYLLYIPHEGPNHH